jgi:ABC-type uncharacterized transport system involved in gliding motility auxiliary subunit
MKTILWISSSILLLALLFARVLYPEYLWLSVGVSIPLVASLGGLIHSYHKELRGRTTAYGINSLITILLVVSIVGVLNFLSARYPHKIDLTKNKIHTFSDQTIKLVKGLQKPVKATLFSKLQQREQSRPLLENYKALNPKFELEYVDPDREPTRAKQAGIKKPGGTLHLMVGSRESNVEDISEEKITNALIKLVKDKIPTLCALTGHGERSFDSQDAEGFASMKKALLEESYDVKDLNILQVDGTKVPDFCDAVGIFGPTRAFFAPEVKAIEDYLASGGRAIVTLDINLKGAEFSPDMLKILNSWYVKADNAMVVDPLSRRFQVDAAVPLIATFSKQSPITKEMHTQDMCYFPFLRPLDIIPGAPAGLTVQWLGQTTPQSFAVTDLKQLATGQIELKEGRDKRGPLNAMISVEGRQKDAKATRNTRLVVFGTSNFATNNYSRFGGNSDLFLNTIAWVTEDENMISIRAKEEGPGRVELSQKEGYFIALLTVILIPLGIGAAGVVIWAFRRRL